VDTSPNPDAPQDGSARAGKSATSKRRRKSANAHPKSAEAPSEIAVAALIVAHDQARRIAATVRAARAIPGIDLVLVVDDGSTDNTQDLARKAGAVVVRHSHHRGRTVAVETGASVIAMRDEPGKTPRAILLLDGGLGNYAIGAAPLVPAVTESVADLAIGLNAGGKTAEGVSSSAARKAIERASNWVPRQPLSRIRCMTREALEAAIPLARGDGLDVGMTLDVLQAGLLVSEVECEIQHKPIRRAKRTVTQRIGRLRDVQMAIGARKVRSIISTTTGAVTNRLSFGGPVSEDGEPAQTAATEPSDTRAAPPAGEVPEAKKTAAPARKTAAPARKTAAPARKKAAPAKKKAAPAKKKAVPASKKPTSKNKSAPSKEHQ